MSQVIGLGINPLPLRLKPSRTQFVQHQFGIRWLVLENQDSESNDSWT